MKLTDKDKQTLLSIINEKNDRKAFFRILKKYARYALLIGYALSVLSTVVSQLIHPNSVDLAIIRQVVGHVIR